jgi:NAD(P)-dependent dehydrogenase (short-subunit alcohol dehydrogenase family)
VAANVFDLTGKVALVTGGNAGIGFAFAQALADAGASVCIWGRSPDRNADAVRQLEARGGRVVAVEVDVTDESAVVDGMAAAVEELGRVDACFANASGLGPQTPSFVESTLADWRETTALVLDSVYVTMREAAKVLVEQGDGGSLVATSSLAANYGAAGGSHAYAAAKAGVVTLMRGLAVQLARHRIRANTILPAWVDSDFMAGVHANPKLGEQVMRRIPMRRWGSPAELGALAVYLAGDGSTWHSGDEFLLDGGYHVA